MGARGRDRVEFEISTNPGAPFAPLVKIASGGELSRFILALKVRLPSAAERDDDLRRDRPRCRRSRGERVGERLHRLAEARKCWSSPTARRSPRAATSTS
jgi:DNA repair protein RecN (Recombination protein N)